MASPLPLTACHRSDLCGPANHFVWPVTFGPAGPLDVCFLLERDRESRVRWPGPPSSTRSSSSSSPSWLACWQRSHCKTYRKLKQCFSTIRSQVAAHCWVTSTHSGSPKTPKTLTELKEEQPRNDSDRIKSLFSFRY